MEIPLESQLGIPCTLFVIALSLRGLFAFLETTITALRLFKLKELAQTIKKYEGLFTTLEKKPDRVLVTILIASSFAEVSAASLGTFIVERLLHCLHVSMGLGLSAGITLTTMIIIVFGEIIPKSLAKGHGEQFFASLLWLINGIYQLLYPLVSVLIYFSDLIIYCLGYSPTSSGSALSSEHEIRFLINHVHEKGLLESEKTEMIQNIFELGRTPVRKIMVPATDIVSLDIHSSLNDALHVFSESQFTRLPVYQNNPDNIIGMVHQKDIFNLLSRCQDKLLKELVRPIMFIPESVKVNQLLRELRQQHMHIAIILNEHGSITGLITLEDILEEIVGDISDEHEPVNEKIIPLQQGGWIIDASITLAQLGTFLHLSFEHETAITLGGFLIEQLQHLPQKGERLSYGDFYFQIQKASNRRVHQVLIFKKNSDSAYRFIESQD